MKLYRSFRADEDLIHTYHGTLKDAHDEAKHLNVALEARVEQVDVPVDKASLIELLNGADLVVQKTWRLSARGGMVECENGE